MDCSPPCSSVHGILQVRILEWDVIPFSGGFSFPRDQTWVSCIASRFFIVLTDQKPTVRKKSHWINIFMLTPVQFSRSVISDSLWHHEPQHTRPPCLSLTPRVYPNPCPLSQGCHLTISSSAVPFSSCPQSFPVSGSFQMSQLFTSGGQSIEVSDSTSVLPVNIQDWFPLRWTG